MNQATFKDSSTQSVERGLRGRGSIMFPLKGAERRSSIDFIGIYSPYNFNDARLDTEEGSSRFSICLMPCEK
jgi:hypothetical protein